MKKTIPLLLILALLIYAVYNKDELMKTYND